MAESAIVGTRIRERRIQNGIRQAELAKRAGISPSYLNLIEHNRRRIGGKTLLKLAEALGTEPALLSEGAEATLIAGLREAAGHAEEDGPELARVEEFAGRFPGWARLLKDLHQRTEGLERTIETLTDRLAHDPHLADSLHEVISAVTAIRSTASILVDTKKLEPEWQARFHRNINEDSSRLAEDAQALVRYLEGAPNLDAEIKSPQDEMHGFLAEHRYHFPRLEREGAGEGTVNQLIQRECAALSAPAQSLTRDVLMQYVRDVRVLPLDQLSTAIEAHGLDANTLARSFDVELATLFRRIAMLPPDQLGPVGLAICDASGTLVFRKPFPAFALPRVAGACSLWPLFQVLGQIQTPIRMRLRQVGRGQESVLALAAATQVAPATLDRPAQIRAHMLLLPDTPDELGGAVREVGVNCRICPLASCPARREPSIIEEGF